MKHIALFTFVLLATAGLYAQTVKPALPIVGSGGVTTSSANAIDSFYLYDAAGRLLVTCKSHDLDTNTFKGCKLAEGRTFDDLFGVIFKELQRLYDKERTKP